MFFDRRSRKSSHIFVILSFILAISGLVVYLKSGNSDTESREEKIGNVNEVVEVAHIMESPNARARIPSGISIDADNSKKAEIFYDEQINKKIAEEDNEGVKKKRIENKKEISNSELRLKLYSLYGQRGNIKSEPKNQDTEAVDI